MSQSYESQALDLCRLVCQEAELLNDLGGLAQPPRHPYSGRDHPTEWFIVQY